MNSESRIQNSEFAKEGFQIFSSVISKEQCDSLAFDLSKQFDSQQSVVKNKIGGVRNLLKIASVAAIAGSPAKNPSHRRVLHIEYAADELPNELKWFERQ